MTTCIFDGIFVHQDLDPCFNDKTSLQLAYEQAKQEKFDRYILIQNGSITAVPDGIKNVVLEHSDPASILTQIQKQARDTDTIVVCNAGNPFFDNGFIREMIDHHERYSADYTYGLGYPTGLVPFILRKDIIGELIALVENDEEEKKDYVFHALYKDINSFDIETFLSEQDLRIYRISVGAHDSGEIALTKKIFNRFQGAADYREITGYLSKNSGELYTVPYALTFELTNYTSINNCYIPDIIEEKKQLSMDIIKKTLDAALSHNKHLHVILGGVGEPLLHDSFLEIAVLLNDNQVPFIIETNGYGIDERFIETMNNFNKDNLHFVVKLDAYAQETYQKIHPNGDFNVVLSSIDMLSKAGFKVYKEIIRMIENEVEIEKYITDKNVDNLIIRKYSTYCGALPDRKVVDLAPLERIPCFQLRRELYIRADGTVGACKFSRCYNSIADLNSGEVDEALMVLHDLYCENACGTYTDYCRSCDDYYIFNF